MSDALCAGTALVVEDEESIAALVHTYLERDGFTVVRAERGEDALGELERRPIRVVVLDIGLPDMDGFDVCRRIRSNSRVPILMLTARDEEPDRVSGLELGADDYLTKPFSPRELLARVKAVLRRAEANPGSTSPNWPPATSSSIGTRARCASRARRSS
jgi:DNA-binding response OmpR family regulator